jgi:uncharacterized protein (DUF1330 family)
MPTYIVGDIHISDPATYQAHLPRALATVARFGGRVIAGGGKIDLLEGDPMPEGIFIIEFQTADAARRWYQSDDYQEALKVRLSSSRGRVFLIEGNEISSAVPVAGLDAGKNWACSAGILIFLVSRARARAKTKKTQPSHQVRDAQCPMGHMGDAWDVAHACLYLASDESKYVTGLELVVDGGISLKLSWELSNEAPGLTG